MADIYVPVVGGPPPRWYYAGCDCSTYMRLHSVEWVSPCKNYYLVKHGSHFSYYERMGSRSVTCGVRRELFRHSDRPYDGFPGGRDCKRHLAGAHPLATWSGRWSKARQAEMEAMVEKDRRIRNGAG